MKRHDSQRGWFTYELYNWMKKDPDIWLVTGDLGYGMFDAIRDEFPDRFINTGAAEMAMMGIAIGLAMEGKKVFVYSITPFLIYRPFETIRNYVDHESIPVRLVGGGRDQDYAHDGFSHYAGDDYRLLDGFVNIKKVWPQKKEDIPLIVDRMVNKNIPWYINLTR